ncbi:hypothetical protein DKZ29_07990 [Limosilactobacillus reuteri]|uniref:AAA family ATPase n=1 Tax=Limosilactobacillus reuteri TaxID=1598 RepID=A0ABD6Y6Q0_LIMRT|nr:AAA family ATPase [Limosilactobacillus reuteri]PWT35097.1 hypothetical protein DKZ24_05155 [Limosilactobacillus reuteri]PWT37210.1 hypothetical protein DKZ35_06500 [Limosilactobacillus reuteri]PWT57596.1 hypothetical protein DKZ29_07990 [Limosilactobacillus reuteri]PWT59958.1 hypothetical protein DKZ30_04770 [Limosilactobacillus reuteri]PWT66538.1 hypothetical protein DKZ28_04840 [Limosilactobacillus reuteri]
MKSNKKTVVFVASVDTVRYDGSPKSEFKIVTLNVKNVNKGELKRNEYGEVVLKGNMTFNAHTDYVITAEPVDDPKWGYQYNYVFSKRSAPVEGMTKEEFIEFLTEITPFANVIAKKYDDPREIFKTKNLDALLKIKGIGPAKAKKMFKDYESQKDYSPAYVAFGQWGFSMTMTRRIVEEMASVDSAIDWLNKDPYHFMKVKGLGFKTIDSKALDHGIAVNDERRVHAYIDNFFEELEHNGDSWIYLSELLNYLRKDIYGVNLDNVLVWLEQSKDYFEYSNRDKTIVTRKELFDIQKDVVRQLLRLLNTPREINLKYVDETITNVEKDQGWEYTNSQKEAISVLLKKKVVLLNGKGGTGKTAILNAVLKVFKKNGYSVATCALSGKAADNLTQITGKRGSTIHKLLGASIRGFEMNENNLLPYDVIVLDEVSMVNVRLFDALVKAIKSNATLIMVGDAAQLDSIGVGVMRAILSTKVIPNVTLTEVHRQAANSAIVEHSLAYREGKKPKELTSNSWKLYGNNKDMGYVFENITNETDSVVRDTIKLFKAALKNYQINDIQILSPTTLNCDKLNAYAQEVANPYEEWKKEYSIKSSNGSYNLRVGDKVINTMNNYETMDPDETVARPIFNGNTGTITAISIETDKNDNIKDCRMVIDFDGIGKVGLANGDIKAIHLGYAITVHKSQGSTIPCVIIALPFQYMLNSRELLYTAITRASKSAFLITSERTLASTVKKSSEKTHRDSLGILLNAYVKERGTE